jgi:hypothetical protein
MKELKRNEWEKFTTKNNKKVVVFNINGKLMIERSYCINLLPATKEIRNNFKAL